MRLLGAVGCAAVGLFCCSFGCSSATQVRQVFMALDSQGTHIRTDFFTDEVGPNGEGKGWIFCDVDYSGIYPDSTIDVLIVQDQGESTLYDGSNNLVPVARQWAFFEDFPTKGPPTLIPFQMPTLTDVNNGLPLPWPVGHFKCEVSVNGALAGEADFTVHYPTQCTTALPSNANAPTPQCECPPGVAESSGNSCVAFPTNPAPHCYSAGDLTNPQACSCVIPDGGANSDRRWLCQ